MSGIGGLNESLLHAGLKSWYRRPGDLIEQPVDGFVVDIVRPSPAGERPDLLIEIQTGNFTAIRGKLQRLLTDHRVLLVHPVAYERWVLREDASGVRLGRRKSPKRGRVEEVFRELVRMPSMLADPNLALEVVLTQEEVVLRNDGAGSWRRKGWSVAGARLMGVVGAVRFDSPGDLGDLLPADLAQPFTNRDLAAALSCPLGLAQKMTYCLVRLNVLSDAGKRGRARLYVSGVAGLRTSPR